MGHDIPYRSSKIYSGTLSDGRFYLIANADRSNRSKLVLYVSERDKLKFTRQKMLIDCAVSDDDMTKCHYPAAVEYNGWLHIIATADYRGDDIKGRGAVLFSVDLKNI